MKFKNKKIQVDYDSAILVDEWTDNNSFPYTRITSFLIRTCDCKNDT